MSFANRILQALTWWHGPTWGTSFTTWKSGEFVGEDEHGNRYFRTRGGKADKALGFERRWVIYNGVNEATKIPTGWYGWMHHLSDTPPTEAEYEPKEWQKPHLPNLTGTANAYRPQGSMMRPDPNAGISAGYDAWSPE